MSAAAPQSPTPKPQLKKVSGVVIPHSPKWYQRLVALVIWSVASLIYLTVRYRLRDPHGTLDVTKAKQSILCTWHNRITLCVKLYFRFIQPANRTPGMCGLVSASKDGALLSAIFERFGVQPVRGSSSRRGAQALRELSTWAERGYDLAITPDGPRGPRYVVADGAIALAQLTGLPLVAGVHNLNWKITLKTWDRLQIPLPFARCELVMGRIIQVPRELTPEQREAIRLQLQNEMLALTKD